MAVSGLHGMICAFGREIQRADGTVANSRW